MPKSVLLSRSIFNYFRMHAELSLDMLSSMAIRPLAAGSQIGQRIVAVLAERYNVVRIQQHFIPLLAAFRAGPVVAFEASISLPGPVGAEKEHRTI